MEQDSDKISISVLIKMSFKDLSILNDISGGEPEVILLMQILLMVKDIMLRWMYCTPKCCYDFDKDSNLRLSGKAQVKDMIDLSNKIAEFKHMVHDDKTDIDELLTKRFYKVVNDVVDTFSK